MQHVERQTEFRNFALRHVAPKAVDHDRSQTLSPDIVARLAEAGYLAPFVPERWGGSSMNMLTYGALHEEMGRACSSVRSLLTVHDMVTFSVLRWGSEFQREKWLVRLVRGEVIGALAVSEPNAGSDIHSIDMVAERQGPVFVLRGQKKWITCGQIASVFVVLAKNDGQPTAFLVERDTAGLFIEPINSLFGTRGAMIALVTFNDCRVPTENLIGRPGFGANSVALSALGLGRYSVACGSTGIAQACLDACYEYAASTHRFGTALKNHQLIQRMITEMIVDLTASRLLCRLAGTMKDERDPQELMQTFIAKYHASTAAMRTAHKAVQIHGANGCSNAYPVERLMRDAKVMEIIEGSTQIQEITIAGLGFQECEQNWGVIEAMSE